ncbi:MAG: hypothetical protein JWQ97_2949 [Phenylobacterium sp.]|nr:hypothetical protein [Phenylobacterium sp.]
MGIPKNPPNLLAWMATLGQMKAYGTILERMCSDGCTFHERQDLDVLIAQLGPDKSLVDERPPCPACDRRNHFAVSAGPGTPFRPLLSGDRGPEPARPPGGWPAWPPPVQDHR